jgi:hypothetical protein
MTTLVLPTNTIRLSPGKGEARNISPTEVKVISVEPTEWQPPAVVYSADGSFFLNLDSMGSGKFYPVTFEGKELVAVKGQDGAVSFYTEP